MIREQAMSQEYLARARKHLVSVVKTTRMSGRSETVVQILASMGLAQTRVEFMVTPIEMMRHFSFVIQLILLLSIIFSIYQKRIGRSCGNSLP
jgi:hypothetical protein